jgi:hypothetical protein
MLLQQQTVDSIQYATSETRSTSKQKSNGSQPLNASVKDDNSIITDRSGAPPKQTDAAQHQDPLQKQGLMDLNRNS